MELLQFFAHAHLPPHLARVSKMFAELAAAIMVACPENTSRDLAILDLLRAKDNAVRALVHTDKIPTLSDLDPGIAAPARGPL